MNAYVSIWKLRLLTGLQYRTAAAAGVATQFFFGLIFIMIFQAFYSQSDPAAQPISLPELTSYVWLQQIFLGFIALWLRDQDIIRLITSGNVAYELCRPCGLYPFWFAKLAATRLSIVLLRCAPIGLIVFILPEDYRLHPPQSWLALLLFVVALLLGMLLVVAISLLIYTSIFWTMSPTGSILMLAVAGEFFAGMVIPVPLMPVWLQSIVYALPFRWFADFPFRVYSGHIPAGDALWGLAVQLAWLTALAGIGLWLLRGALKQAVIQGG